MEPESFTTWGFFMLLVGFVLTALGANFIGQFYYCSANSGTCTVSSTDLAARLGYAIPLLTLGSLMITPGAIFVAAGHITEHLRPAGVPEEESEDESPNPLRVCVKCGHQVDPSATYCPDCGKSTI